MSKLSTDLTPDDPVVLDAGYQIGSKQDRRKIDDQIRDLQQAMVDTTLVNGTSSKFKLSQTVSSPILPGMAFCASQDAPAGSTVVPALAAALAASGSPLGVAAEKAPGGSYFRGLMLGVLNPSLFNLGAGAATTIGVDTTNGFIKRIPSPGNTDQILGTCDTAGTCTLTGPARSGKPGVDGNSAGYIPITVMINKDVASLSAGPTAWAGYTIQPGDQVGLSNQTNTARIGVATYAGSGVYTMNSTQPPNNSQLVTLQGTPALQSFIYQTGSISALNGSTTGLYQGAWTAANVAPDGRGVPLVDNPIGPMLALTNDGAYHTILAFDFVARGFTTGRIIFTAIVAACDSAHDAMATMRLPFKCSATPAAGAPGVSYALDMQDDGSGPYFDVRWFVVGTALCLQVKSLEAGTINYVAAGSYFVAQVQ